MESDLNSNSDVKYLVRVLRMTRQVRDMQRTYFKTRSREDLLASKQLESELDDLIKHDEPIQEDLFPTNSDIEGEK